MDRSLTIGYNPQEMSDSILARVSRFSLYFLDTVNVKEVYKIVVEKGTELLNGVDGGVLLQRNGIFELVYGTSESMQKTKARKKGFAYQAFTQKKTIVMVDPEKQEEDFRNAHPNLKDIGIVSAVFIPLSFQKKSIGVLVIRFDKKISFTRAELDALNIFGAMATLSIRKALLYSETVNALKTRDLFMSTAAHELKTPMTAISGYAQLLNNKFQDPSSSEYRWVHNLSSEVFRMTQLINELLIANQIKSGKFKYTWKEVGLRSVLDETIKNFTREFPDRVITFKDKLDQEDDTITADKDKLLQVFDNILDNAAKFSSQEKPITVSLFADDLHLVVEIDDQGEGIQKTDLPHVFEEFYKSQNDHFHQGMGLGLYLVRIIILHHHGTIRINSKKNRGTRVTIQLPKRNYE